VAPRLEELVDLGALPLTGPLSRDASDGVFTPGEWMALLGPGIARKDASVSIAGAPVPVAAYLEKGLIVRVPRGLSPRTPLSVTVSTQRGQSARGFRYVSHVVVSDVSGNALRFLPMAADADKLFLEPYDLELTRVRKHVFSADGGLVYAVQAHGEAEAGTYTLATVHAGAPGHPALLDRVPVRLSAVPQDLVMAGARRQLWLLSQRELVVFDLVQAAHPRELARVSFAEGTAWSLASLAGDTRAVVLERDHNLLWLFDMSGPRPMLVHSEELAPVGMPRASLRVLADPRDPTRFWLLQGKSLGRFAKRVHTLLTPLRGVIQQAKSAVGLSVPPPETRASTDNDRAPAPPARILAFVLGDTLRLERELALPDASVPLFMSLGRDGRLLVSVISADTTELETLGDNPANLPHLTSWLGRTLQFGRVLAIDPTGVRGPESLAQGMAMFFEVDQLPDGQLVASVMRLGVKAIPPGLNIDWNIEAPHLQAVAMRSLSWTFVLPPYVSPPVSVQ
jgi:hypothetical protein